jgi:epidermal growth factor receptor substrate 15
LSSANAAYETETKLLSTLRERLGVQTAEIQKAREELIRAESDLSAVRVEKAEIGGTFLRDKDDVRELQRKMADTGTEIAGLKIEIEKAKKEAKQQRGLLAIARKQLSTKEAEKAKVQKELEDAEEEIKEVTAEREWVEGELEKDVPSTLQNGHHDIPQSPFAQSSEADQLTVAVAQPLPASLPVSPDPSTPSGTSMKSNNPFDRVTRSASTTSSPRSQPVSFSDAALVPSPSTAFPVETAEDPFGISQAFSESAAAPAETESAATETESATPRQEPAVLSITPQPIAEPISPGSEFGSELFSTPSSTTAGLSQSPATRMSEVPSIDTQFPPLEDMPGSFPTSSDHHDGETDLGGPLKELDAEESDSDSDEEPLSDVRDKLKTFTDNTPSKVPPLNGILIPSTSFADAFGGEISGSESTDVQTPKPSSTALTDSLASSFTSEAPSIDAFGAPLSKISNPFPAPPVAGVNAFDEAMGKIPSNGVTSPLPNISFESAFEDNFDFASASTAAPSFPPPPSAANGNAASSPALKPTGFEGIYGTPVKNGALPQSSVDTTKPFLFEDTFSTGSIAPKAPTLPNQKSSLSTAAAISFDDAFGGVDSSQALRLDNTFGSASSRASAATSASRQGQPAGILKPFPAAQISPPLSPQGGPSSPRMSSIRGATPPPRSTSPPARLGSPAPRPSTSSSGKDGHEKLKEPPTRHSRLSVSPSCSCSGMFTSLICLSY